MPQLWILSEAGEIFGLDYRGVSALLPALGIETKKVRHHARARGLDFNDMARIAQALNKPWPPVASQAEAVA